MKWRGEEKRREERRGEEGGEGEREGYVEGQFELAMSKVDLEANLIPGKLETCLAEKFQQLHVALGPRPLKHL